MLNLQLVDNIHYYYYENIITTTFKGVCNSNFYEIFFKNKNSINFKHLIYLKLAQHQ